MGLFDRASRAVSANFNALLDRLEDPKKEVDLTISEMEEHVRGARQEIVRSVASEKQLKKKADELKAEGEKWERRAELAVKHGDDDLAREALRQRRRLAGEVERAEALRVEQRNAALELKTDLERMERTVQEVKAKRGTLAARVAQSRAGGGAEALGARPGSNAFSEFSRMEEQIEGVEAAIAAQKEVEEALGGGRGPSGMTREQVEARFLALESKAGGAPSTEDVDDELRELKTKLRVEPG
jgi:phage shock protein A